MIIKFIGLCIVLGCLVIVHFFENSAGFSGSFKVFHWPAINLTFLGPIGLILFSVEFVTLKNAVKHLFISPSARKKKYELNLDELITLTPRFYSMGSSALREFKSAGNPKIEKLIERLIMRIPLSDIKDMMVVEKDKEDSRLQQLTSLLGLGVRYSPSIGMLGTILGMVQLLSSISDPTNVGSHMSLALLTTFYGLFFSLIVWVPCQHRLQTLHDVEIDFSDHLIHWIDLMEKRKPAHYFEETTTNGRLAKVQK